MLLITCIKIFFARILDVTLGTIKTVYIVKEKRIISTILSFFEVFVWYYAAKSALNIKLNSIFIPISYSAGFALGTYIGTFLSSYFIKGNVTINVISKKGINKIVNSNVIKMDNHNNLYIINTPKKEYKNILNKIKNYDNKAIIYSNESNLN